MSAGGARRRWSPARCALWTGVAFASGAIPTGRLVTRAVTGRRLDDLGDGKPGSSNVARSVGWKPGAAVLALDALKAYAPATAARHHGAGHGAAAALGITSMAGHITVVHGRGAAAALGAAFAMDPAMMAVACVPLVGGSVMHRHAEAVTATALSLPLISLALHRSPRRALGPLALIAVLFAARLRGSRGAGLPDSPEVWRNRFLLDRDER
jgi:glycerol-3-phosphate acyltransferase PlsY